MEVFGRKELGKIDPLTIAVELFLYVSIFFSFLNIFQFFLKSFYITRTDRRTDKHSSSEFSNDTLSQIKFQNVQEKAQLVSSF